MGGREREGERGRLNAHSELRVTKMHFTCNVHMCTSIHTVCKMQNVSILLMRRCNAVHL